MSREIRPETRLGRGNPKRIKMMFWAIGLLAFTGGLYAAYHFAVVTEIEMPVERVHKGDFVISVRTRGDIKSTRSSIVYAPQVPNLRILRMAKNGALVKAGDVVVEFDRDTQENNIIQRTNTVTNAEQQIVTLKARQRSSEEDDINRKVQNEFSLERAKLDAGKAAVLSDIDGQKARITVGVSEGQLRATRATMRANRLQNDSSMRQQIQRKDNAVKLLEQSKGYLNQMVLRAPADGVVNILTNFNARGTFGRTGQPPFKEGDNVWTGAQIMEIPDLSEMYIDLKLEEVDRGKIALGQEVKIRVDSIPDQEFIGVIDFISPAAQMVFTGVGANQQSNAEKNFPARATLKNLDPRLRPGTSASAEIIVEKQPNTLMIRLQANFDKDGKPIAYVQNGKDFEARSIQIGKRNEDYVVVTGGLQDGDVVALEDPVKLARSARKKKL